MSEFYNVLKDGFAKVKPEYVFLIFLIIVVAAFAVTLLLSEKKQKGYISAFKKAVGYLSDPSIKIVGNTFKFFDKNYVVYFPQAMQNRLSAYFETTEGRPSSFLTEAECIKLKADRARNKTFFAIYDLVIFAAFLLSAAVTFHDGAAFGIAAILPLVLAVIFRYTLKLRAAALDTELSESFYELVYALDDSVGIKDNGRLIEPSSVILARASALIERIIKEETEAQRYYFINETDGLNKELKMERLYAIAENVALICGEETSAATLKKVFAMISDARSFYKSDEETEIVNECLVKLKNAAVRAERR
ncbi:MAG: hypothetical protein LBT30_01670 [Clostridiales bacterium]|jgi:hypothetical protein|nr:hypothetical protein [Clostridiales bacterium]